MLFCVYMTYVRWSEGYDMKVEVRGQLCDIISPLPSLYNFQESNSGDWALNEHLPLFTGSAHHQPLNFMISNLKYCLPFICFSSGLWACFKGENPCH